MGETLLTLDTATLAGSVAVTRGEQVLGEILLNVRSTHSERLLSSVEQLLSDVGLTLADIDAFGVVVGPGSFTGVRIGVATGKGLAMATGKPLVAVSSLESLAFNVPLCRFPVCALLDARKSEVYAGLYEWRQGLPALVRPEEALPPDRLLGLLEGEVAFVGDGALAYRSLIVERFAARAHFVPAPLNLPRASSAAAFALARLRNGEILSPEALSPVYLRPSEAEILWARRAAEGMIHG